MLYQDIFKLNLSSNIETAPTTKQPWEVKIESEKSTKECEDERPYTKPRI